MTEKTRLRVGAHLYRMLRNVGFDIVTDFRADGEELINLRSSDRLCGELLTGERREALRQYVPELVQIRKIVSSLSLQMVELERAGQMAEAMAFGRLLVEYDPFDKSAHRVLFGETTAGNLAALAAKEKDEPNTRGEIGMFAHQLLLRCGATPTRNATNPDQLDVTVPAGDDDLLKSLQPLKPMLDAYGDEILQSIDTVKQSRQIARQAAAAGDTSRALAFFKSILLVNPQDIEASQFVAEHSGDDDAAADDGVADADADELARTCV
jgi:hypothetical protein